MWRDKLIAAVFASSSEPILVVDRATRTIVDCNIATEAMFGLSRAELIGRSTSTLAAEPEHWQALPRGFFAALDAGEVADLRMLGRRRDGTVFPARVRAKSFEHDGKWYNILYLFDLTQLEAVQERLRQEACALRERVKELRCVYRVSDALARTEVSLDERLAALPRYVKEAFQHPAHAHVRIEMRGMAFSSFDHAPGAAEIAVEIRSRKGTVGRITVAYDNELPPADQGAFLAEERVLLEDLALRIGAAAERDDAERERRQTEARLRYLAENLPARIAISDWETGEILYLNNLAAVEFGCVSAAEAIERRVNIADIYTDPAERRRFRDVANRAGSVSGYVLKTRFGHYERWTSVYGELIEFEGRKAFFAVRIDITEQRQNEARLQFLSEKLPVSIAIVDEATGAILYANPRLRDDLDIGEHESLADRTVEQLYFDSDEMADVRAEFARERRLAGRVVRGRIRGQMRWHAIYGEPIEFEGHDAIYTVRVDVTEQRQSEEALQRAQRLDAIGQLAGGVAHDFNNLLTALAMQFDLLREEPGLGATARRGVEIANAAVERGAALTRQLLSFARKKELKPNRLNAVRLVEDMKPFLARTLGGHIRVATRFDEDAAWIRCDQGLLESALLNLAINARDAMKEGGTITISVSARRVAGEAGGDRPGDYVEIAVADTGTGMPPEVLDRAFEPFFTTKDVGRGTGLGLSMVHGFVAQSQGFTRIESKPGEGTTVRLCFPRQAAEEATEAEAALAAPHGTESILLVDDDELVRPTVALQLRGLGYRVAEARDGDAALRMLDAERPDLVVTDLMMPGMTGLRLAAEARRRRPALPILVVSGSFETGDREAMRAMGAVAFCDKPFTIAELGKAIRDLLDSARAHQKEPA